MIVPGTSPHIFKINEKDRNEFLNRDFNWDDNPLGLVTLYRTYLRKKANGSLETWNEAVVRVIEGMFSILKTHILNSGLQWQEDKAQELAYDAAVRLFEFKWTPPGRGLWMMGTDFMWKRGSAALNNCGFCTTENIDKEGSEPFRFLMDMSMLGVGIGFDTKGAGKVSIQKPHGPVQIYEVEDTREGWVKAIGDLIDSYFYGTNPVDIDTSNVRAYGEPIKGFGGVASGPLPLIQGFNGIKDILNNRVGEKITSVDITDIQNIIGKIVVAGNVRRCLPKDTLVHTETGLKKIQEVQVGENVYTSSGLYPVAENVTQGIQSIWSIETQLGKFECTKNHRVAVMDTPNSYIWKRAFELMPEDKLVFPCNVVEGTKTSLPEWYYDYPDHSTTCSPITIPELDTDMAWFIGVLHGDGYVFTNRSKGGANAEISIAVHADDVEQKDKVVEQIKRFGVNARILQPKTSDNCFKIRVASKQLAWYLEQFKKPKESIDIPECILQGKIEIRLAYLAGVLDADGCVKNKPISSCVTVYKKFADQLQNLYASVGIPARTVQIKSNEVTEKGWQTKYSVNIVGQYTKNRFSELLSNYSYKIDDMKAFLKNQRSFGFPAEWIVESGVKYMGKWANTSKQMTLEKYRELGGDAPYIPIEVLSVDKDVREDETFDLSVPEAQEFVCGQGILVHNTAEIAFSDPSDKEFRQMKSWIKNPEGMGAAPPKELEKENSEDYNTMLENPFGDEAKEIAEKYKDKEWAYKFGGWRWTSNNSIFATVGMDYSEIAESISENGEPGLAWLENMQNFGRMIDPPNYKDTRARGGNPCLEQTLEPYELCTLVETYPVNNKNSKDYNDTLKIAYLYAKAVTLMATHNTKTNTVMSRNRRIGCSQSGIIDAIAYFGRHYYQKNIADRAYHKVQEYDVSYSEWLGVPRSIKTTSVKPSGSVSLLANVSPGVHFPKIRHGYRTMRLSKDSPIVEALKKANYHVEPSNSDPYQTVVAYFPVIGSEDVPTEADSTIWEQFTNAVLLQKYWADNQVSITISFKPEEKAHISKCLSVFDNELKGVSLLPLIEHGFSQAPYIPADKKEVEAYKKSLNTLDLSVLNIAEGENAGANKFCDGDSCTI